MRQSQEALQKVLASTAVANAAQTPGALRDAKTRVQVTAALATATLPRPELAGARHRDGGYGWVGPVFWPFATYDLFDAALWGEGVDATFWGYGAADLATGLFGIYPDDDLSAYARHLTAAGGSQPTLLARMCGEGRRDIAGVEIATVRSSVHLDDAQGAALDALGDAMMQASQRIAAVCPTALPFSARERLALIGRRLDAMIVAADLIAPRLTEFIGLLDDTQKAQFAALGAPSGAASPPSAAPMQAAAATSPATAAAAQACAAAQAMPPWPKASLERAVGRGDEERKALDGLQAALGKATAQLTSSCQPADAGAPPARLVALRSRLEAMRTALDGLTAAVGPIYATLDEVQTADFDAVGSEPARAMVMAAVAQRYRALQSAAARRSTGPAPDRRSGGARSTQVEPADTRAPDTNVADTTAADMKASGATVVEAKSTDAKSGDAKSGDAKPSDAQLAVAAPVAKPAGGSEAEASRDKTKRAEVQPERRGHGRRHLTHHARRAPGPVRVIGRMLGSLIP
jgi:hypothetical protein